MRVWLPFTDEDAARAALGELPEGMAASYVTEPPAAGTWPEGADEVVFWALPNGIDHAVFSRLGELPKLRAIQLGSAGFKHVLPHLPEGVELCNAGGVHDTAVAEIALGLAIAQSRHLDVFARAQAAHEWSPRGGTGIADKRVLIVGYGRIGAAIEERLLPFEVASVTRHANHARTEPVEVHGAADLDALLPEADLVFVITPWTPATDKLLDARRLALLPDDTLVVNVGRGKVIDTDALTAEVASGRLRCALDVVDPEPLPSDHPLWNCANAFIAPHVGGASAAFGPRMDALLARQLRHLAAGEPLENVVN